MGDKNDRFRVTLARRKNFLLSGVWILWLLLWGWGLVIVASGLLRGQIKEIGFFVVFFILSWLAGWLVGGGLALYGLLWSSLGKETIVVTNEELVLTRSIGSYNRGSRYDVAKIRSLRLVEEDQGITDFLLSLRIFGIGNGQLTFDCGTTVVIFAEGIDRTHAQNLLEELRSGLQGSPEQLDV